MSSTGSSSAAAASPSAVTLLGGCTATSNTSFFLTTTPTYRVHPLVIFSILDHYQRRNDGQARVVGTLLGQQLEGNVIEIKQAFPVPHEEEEESVSRARGETCAITPAEMHRTMECARLSDAGCSRTLC
jgi:hypothetical protein